MSVGMIPATTGQFVGQNAWKNTQLVAQAFPVAIVVGTPLDTIAINVLGFSIFMLGVDFSGALSNLAVSLAHLDPTTGTVFAVKAIQAGLTPQPDFTVGFGNGSGVLASDVFHLIKLRLVATVANVTVNNLFLWARSR